MKARVVCVMFACALSASTVRAQAPAAPQAGQKVPLNEGLRRAYNGIKLNLTEAAQKLGEADYNYRPSPDIRGFGGQLAHVANAQFNACAAARGMANPYQGQNLEQTKTTRADIIAALADSFAFCDSAFATLTDQSAIEFVRQGMNEVARGSVLANLISHGNEEYGILTVYLRTKGLVPPSTERGMRGRGAGTALTAPARGQ
ncbi:MAG: DinB family protein [Acidobacteria bacterium]|nr:DinB family protein [Acidobacteriota bacterium]